jgi:hypothetical protein
MIPALEYRLADGQLFYRWTDVVPGFDMPVEVTLRPGQLSVIRPTEEWQSVPVEIADPADFRVDENYYVVPRPVEERREQRQGQGQV